jgi:hypothetical protein
MIELHRAALAGERQPHLFAPVRARQQFAQQPFVERAPRIAPCVPIATERRSTQVVDDRQPGMLACRLCDAAAAQPQRVDRQSTAPLPLDVHGVVMQHHLRLAQQSRQQACLAQRRHHSVEADPDHPVDRRGRQAGERFVGDVPAQRRSPRHRDPFLRKEGSQRGKQSVRFGRAERQRLGIAESDAVGIDVAMQRREQAPGEVERLDGVARGHVGRPRQQAVGTR